MSESPAKSSRQGQSIGDLLFEKEEKKIKWYHYFFHLGYYIRYCFLSFFSKPLKKEEKPELDLLEKVDLLLETKITDKNITLVSQLVRLHRVIENTKARRRLEKWSLRVIASYLLIVLLVVIANYLSPEFWLRLHLPFITIPSEIMITILSTTTVNIIGLGLIVLRGHFLSRDVIDDNVDYTGKDKKRSKLSKSHPHHQA